MKACISVGGLGLGLGLCLLSYEKGGDLNEDVVVEAKQVKHTGRKQNQVQTRAAGIMRVSDSSLFVHVEGVFLFWVN